MNKQRKNPNRDAKRIREKELAYASASSIRPLVKRADGAFIIKVQVALTEPKHCLIYNSDRSLYLQNFEQSLLDLMGPNLKLYFWAKMETNPGPLQILDEAPRQDW